MALTYVDWKKDYRKDLKNVRALIIDNPSVVNKKTLKGEDGSIFTREFGSALNTDEDIREFSCECGNYYARFYEGEICPICNTVVEERYGGNLDRYGWIELGEGNWVIIPQGYLNIEKIISPANLRSILDYKCKMDGGGNSITDVLKNKKHPYENYGMLKFKEHFEEILLWFLNKRSNPTKKHQLMVKHLIKNKDKLFVDVVPVISPILRPAFTSSSNNQFGYDKLNEKYVNILSYASIMKKKTTTEFIKLESMYNIQISLNELEDYATRSKVKGKRGIIRKTTIGSQLSFSSRMVIIPYVKRKKFRMDNIIIPYKAFLEIYKFEILNLVMKNEKHRTVWEVLDEIEKTLLSDEASPKYLSIIRFMIKNHKFGGMPVLLNRNPTLDMGSIQAMLITDIYEDPNIFVMGIPLTSLKSMNADFDGDVLNLWSLKEKSVATAFMNAFNPRNLILDVTGDGGFNSAFSLDDYQIVNMYSFLSEVTRKDLKSTPLHIDNDRELAKKIKEYIETSGPTTPFINPKANPHAKYIKYKDGIEVYSDMNLTDKDYLDYMDILEHQKLEDPREIEAKLRREGIIT